MSDDIKTKARNQVEFYFSDSNFLSDKFLRTQAASNPDGFVPLSVIASFKRMAELTSDLAMIRESLTGSEIVELSEDAQNVRRKIPLPENDPTIPRSIYAKPFAADATMDDIKKFFSEFGKVLSVRMRRYPQSNGGGFKGSVYVEFSTEDEAKSVIEKKSELKINDQDAVIMWKSEHIDEERAKAHKSLKKEKKEAEKKEEEENNAKAFTPKTIIRFPTISAEVAANLTREIFKKVCMDTFPENPVKFIDYRTGDLSCAIRFENPFDLEQGSLSFDFGNLDYVRLGDEEVSTYGKQVAESRRAQFGKRRGSHGGRGGGRGGRGAKRFKRE
eukprot:ANDGO_08490.mRNA.1 La protein homolog